MPLGLAKDSMLNLAELASKYDEDDGEGSASKIEYDERGERVMRVSTGGIEDAPDEEKKFTDDAAEDADLEATGAVNGGEEEKQPEPMPEYSQKEQDSAPAEPTFADDRSATASSNGSVRSVTASSNGSVASDSVAAAGSVASDSAAAVGSVASDSVGAAVEQTPAANSYGQYSGFTVDYHGYEHYEDHASYNFYAGNLLLDKKEQQGFWCCLFPWTTKEQEQDHNIPGSESLVSVSGTRVAPPSRSMSKDDDEVSTGSDVFGEKLSDKDRQAVLARLRLSQPDLATTNNANSSPEDSTKQKEKGLLNGIVPSDGKERPQQLKGILKRKSRSRQGLDKLNQSSSSDNGDQTRRRSLFPSYENNKKPKKNLKAIFSPMARVMTVKSQKDMDDVEKGIIWWQKRDYEEFRKTGRMITKAMLEGGSEIWLATNRSWLLPNQGRSTTLKHAYSLAERQAAFKKGDLNAKKEYEETRDKWWHKFGHSRRGLEHVASIDEGRQRQANVREAVKAVIDEQRRQKVFHREDPDKLRMVSIQQTSWASDLALAAGASDEDVVSKKFDDESRRSREFYLLKLSRADKSKGTSVQKVNVPAFMRPALTMTTVTANRLDANTVSQIKYRQTQKKKPAAPSQQKASAPATTKVPDESIKTSDSVPLKEQRDASLARESMAKKAAGFASGEEVANMSAILTGMGAIPKKAVNVGGP